MHLPSLSDIWHCVEAFWTEPLKTGAPVAKLGDLLKVEGHAKASYPGVPPLPPHCPPNSTLCQLVSGQEAATIDGAG